MSSDLIFLDTLVYVSFDILFTMQDSFQHVAVHRQRVIARLESTGLISLKLQADCSQNPHKHAHSRCVDTYTHAHIHTRTHTHTGTHKHTHTHTQAHTQAHTHARTHTHTHIHTNSLSLFLSLTHTYSPFICVTWTIFGQQFNHMCIFNHTSVSQLFYIIREKTHLQRISQR